MQRTERDDDGQTQHEADERRARLRQPRGDEQRRGR